MRVRFIGVEFEVRDAEWEDPPKRDQWTGDEYVRGSAVRSSVADDGVAYSKGQLEWLPTRFCEVVPACSSASG